MCKFGHENGAYDAYVSVTLKKIHLLILLPPHGDEQAEPDIIYGRGTVCYSIIRRKKRRTNHIHETRKCIFFKVTETYAS
jgi:hypothetical protein